MKMESCDIIIIGAGAAGLMCALTAGARGKSVLVIEHAQKAGKKILMSGGGRCNFTNLYVSPDNYVSGNRHFCRSALSRYTAGDFIKMVERHCIPYHEKKLGQLFCDNKAKDILNMLLSECSQVGVNISLGVSVRAVSEKNDGFILETSSGVFCCKSLVIATGGLSIPTMGSSPFGYKIAEQFGLRVLPTRAGLVPFTLHVEDKERFAQLSGVSVNCRVSCGGQSFEDGLLFTHRGLSGPAMLQISSYWNPGDALKICLSPQVDLMAELINAKKNGRGSLLRTELCRILPKSLVSVWLDESSLGRPIQQFSDSALCGVADKFSSWVIVPNGTEGYRTAEVTLGGVDCSEISSKTFEAKKVSGLYFIGEVLDVTGWLGGYNFQWAWSSGSAAGSSV